MTQVSDPSELILLPSLKAHEGPNGGLVLTQKYLNGAAQYARSWPGRVTSLVQLRKSPTSDMDHVEIRPGQGPTPLELRPPGEKALSLRLQSAAVVLGFLSPFELPTAKLCRRIGVPIVFVSEYSPRTEKQIIDAEVRNPILRWRRKLWIDQADRKRREALDFAAGIQCSGSPSFDVYRKYNANALVFFDNRVPEAEVISEEALERKLASVHTDRPLRLVFGGRLIAMKGVLELPKVARELRRLDVKFTLDIYGSGDLEASLQHDLRKFGLEDQVQLKGVLDFQDGWIPLLKEQVDLFLCCHPQGDPSSTYPEVMSCGVPIAGYDNEAFAGIVRHSGSGWLCPMNEPEQLATIVAQLDKQRSNIASAAIKAREFALTHAFEKTFKNRVDHLVRSSRLPDGAKASYFSANQYSASVASSK